MESKTVYDHARQSLRIMQAGLEKAKTTHGDLFTFGDCASIYASLTNLNTFIEQHEKGSKQENSPEVSKTEQAFPTLTQPMNVRYPN